MKKSAVAIALMAVVGVTACNKQAETEVPAEAAQTQTVLETQQQKQAYAIGSSVGQFIGQKLDMQDAVDMELNRQLVIEGFVAALNGEPKMTQEEMQQELQALETAFQEKQQVAQQAAAQENVAAGLAFLAENGKKDGVVTTESGLQYEVMVAGDGVKPKAEDTVTVHYVGTLTDGTPFDSSVDRGEPAQFPLNRVIPGWTEGVQLMNVGAKYRFVLPSELAYGERAAGDVITPNSVLVFEVELLDVEAAATIEAEVEVETTAEDEVPAE